MADSQEGSPGEDYFNDLTQQPSAQQVEDVSEQPDAQRRGSQEEAGNNGQVPKPKRIACVLCRKRKLKCDGGKPACGTCKRLQHDCSYDEARRKSGPKRGYVKALEARLAQVETLLKTQDDPSTGAGQKGGGGGAAQGNGVPGLPYNGNISLGMSNVDVLGHSERVINQLDQPQQTPFPHTAVGGIGTTSEEQFPWEMIGLGLDEPLPTQDVVDELNRLYFEKVHPSMPMIHRPRYYAAMNLAPHMRPPVCLRYAMWCNAAAVSDKYEQLQEHFYLRARKYIQQDEMRGHGESMITVSHCQTWTLLATYEFKLMYFPRAWMSAGRACRMTQMMGLHRLDGQGLDVKQCLPPPRDWTEREERRRTFWAAFCIDRYSSIGTGWPMTIEEKDIMTQLPAEEEAYEMNRPTKTRTLAQAFDPDGAGKLTGFSGVVLLACLFGRNLTHLHRPGPDDADDDLNGEFWKRHRMMDNVLLNTALALPSQLRLPSGLNNPNVVFLNMCIHTSTICLHQAAIFKADKHRMPARISAESKVRCITAAAEIASIMRQICHLDLCGMNPFISFCLYVAARVFVQYLKSRPKDTQIRSSLQFLLQAMQAIKRRNPLTESFLVQLDVDLEAAGIEDTSALRVQLANKSPMEANRSEACPMQQFHLDNAPTYGDIGLAAYNQPSGNPNLNSTQPSRKQNTAFNLNDTSQMTDESLRFMSTGSFELPQRPAGASPGSNQSSSGVQQRSPQSFNQADMDFTPDTSSGDHLTPNSNSQHNASGHTSNQGYSPQNLWQPDSMSYADTTNINNDSGRLTGILSNNMNSFTDFDMSGFQPDLPNQQQQPGFVLPRNWPLQGGGGSTGMTPGVSTGLTPGASGMGDMLNMTDAEWSLMMEGMQFDGTWQTGLDQEGVYLPSGRRMG